MIGGGEGQKYTKLIKYVTSVKILRGKSVARGASPPAPLVAGLPWRYVAEIGTANLIDVSA